MKIKYLPILVYMAFRTIPGKHLALFWAIKHLPLWRFRKHLWMNEPSLRPRSKNNLNLAAMNKFTGQCSEHRRVPSNCLLIEQLTAKRCRGAVPRGDPAEVCMVSWALIWLHRVMSPWSGRIQFQYCKWHTCPLIHHTAAYSSSPPNTVTSAAQPALWPPHLLYLKALKVSLPSKQGRLGDSLDMPVPGWHAGLWLLRWHRPKCA